MRNTRIRQIDAHRDKIAFGWDGNENEIGFLAANEIASSRYRGVAGLNGLMRKWHVFTDNNVNVFNLLHGKDS